MSDLLSNKELFIIDTRTVSNGKQGLQGWEYVELTDNPEYAQLCGLAKERRLEEKFPREDRRLLYDASNFHTPRMMSETPVRFKTDSDGLIGIKDEATAKKILEILQLQDKEIKLSKYGKQFGESPLPAATEVKKK